MRSALDLFGTEGWPVPAEETKEIAGTPLLDFVAALPAIQWSPLLQRLRTDDVTQKQLVFVLKDGWEAVWPPPDLQLRNTAVDDLMNSFVPTILRQAWTALLCGADVQLFAPADFWHTFWAAPFLSAGLSSLHPLN